MIDLDANTTMADLVRAQARLRPEAVALAFEGRVTTFGALDKRTNQVARQLIADGFRPQERIGMLAKNADTFYELMFGACKARCALAPVNFRLAAPEIAAVLSDAAVRILFVGQDFYDLAEAAVALMPEKPRLVALDGPRAGLGDYTQWRDAGMSADPMLVELPTDDVIQLYTSGTTGLPKGVQLTNASYHAFLRGAEQVEGFSYAEGDTVLNAMPLFHVAGVNVGLAGLAQACRVLIIKDIAPGPILSLIGAEKVNHSFFAPAIILMLMNAPEMETADVSSMKTISYGASPISEDLLRRAAARFGCGFVQFYGMTETAGAGATLSPRAHDPELGKLRSCGVAWPNVEVKLAKADGSPVPVGEVGEVWIRGGMNMKGYWNRPDATRESLVDGWMKTGDAAYQDADGYFYIYDRVKDMIVTGGENVYPAEVENAIMGHPDVADVAVIGVPDEKWGEAVKAIIVAKPGAAPTAESVIAYAKERIAGYKTPKSVDVVETIPRNPSGKILRRELRAPFWAGRDRQVS